MKYPSIKMVWGMEEQAREFSGSALDGIEWWASRSRRFTPVKETLTCLIHVAYQHKPYAHIGHKLSSMAD